MLKIDIEKLMGLFNDFYELTGVAISLFDEEFTELIRYPQNHCEFCALIRQNPEADKKCRESDSYAFRRCRETQKCYTYRCHMNLTETATPVIFGGKTIGYIIMGQIADENSHFSDIEKAIPKHIDLSQIRILYESLPRLTDRKIKAAAHILDACASYLYAYNLITEQAKTLTERIEKYIENNIAEKLTVENLLNEFTLSRTELYSIFEKSFSMTVANYIRYKKLEYAKTLLQTTSLPVWKIALKCGIDDYNYFSKIFRKQFGITATKMRGFRL